MRLRRSLIPYITAGDPHMDATLEFMHALSPHADVIEMGMPFSDPIADGPVIQASHARALEGGATVDGVFETIRRFTDVDDTPVVVMTYHNIIYRRGIERFVGDAREAGVTGLLSVDLPIEESSALCAACEDHGVETVFLAAPNTPDERLARIDAATTGYVYLVSRFGTTGVSHDVSGDLGTFVSRARSVCSRPLAVGFGISTPLHVEEVLATGADGVIVGSALVRCIEEQGGDAAGALGSCIGELSTGAVMARNR
ncbi:tryptophan synthase subunit alpha [archaeon]|nr:MAG: tryptophan synthase subunit alpha [archaeon]